MSIARGAGSRGNDAYGHAKKSGLTATDDCADVHPPTQTHGARTLEGHRAERRCDGDTCDCSERKRDADIELSVGDMLTETQALSLQL